MKAVPEVIWISGQEVGAYRVVRNGNQFIPEKRHSDDAMGEQCWQFAQWGGDWCSKLLSELLQEKNGESK